MNKLIVDDVAMLPTRGTTWSAGYDFISPCDIHLAPGEKRMIDSGVRIMLDSDKYLAIHVRSSIGAKGIILSNGTGIIDSDYYSTGETIKGMLWNTSDEHQIIRKGERYMQGIIHTYYTVENDTVRNAKRKGGIGSTGR